MNMRAYWQTTVANSSMEFVTIRPGNLTLKTEHVGDALLSTFLFCDAYGCQLVKMTRIHFDADRLTTSPAEQKGIFHANANQGTTPRTILTKGARIAGDCDLILTGVPESPYTLHTPSSAGVGLCICLLYVNIWQAHLPWPGKPLSISLTSNPFIDIKPPVEDYLSNTNSTFLSKHSHDGLLPYMQPPKTFAPSVLPSILFDL